MVRVLGFGTAVVVAIVALATLGEDESAASGNTHPEVRIAMEEAVRTMPGYEADPETFDRYFTIAHPKAVVATFVEKGLDPTISEDHELYVGEVYRQMLDQAFTESRTDLADILTRAYMAVVRQE